MRVRAVPEVLWCVGITRATCERRVAAATLSSRSTEPEKLVTMGLANDTLDLIGLFSGISAVLCVGASVNKRFPQLPQLMSKLFEQVSKKSIK